MTDREMEQRYRTDRDVLANHVRWMAQTVHQAYHAELGCQWVECPRDACVSSKRALISIGLPLL